VSRSDKVVFFGQVRPYTNNIQITRSAISYRTSGDCSDVTYTLCLLLSKIGKQSGFGFKLKLKTKSFRKFAYLNALHEFGLKLNCSD